MTCAECHGPVAERDVIAQETNVVTMLGLPVRVTTSARSLPTAVTATSRASDGPLSRISAERQPPLASAEPVYDRRVRGQENRGHRCASERDSITSMRTAGAACAVVAAAGVGCGVLAQSGADRAAGSLEEWPTYGHDPGGMRFSPLTQITPANVSQLKVAWVYHMKPAATLHPGSRRPRARAPMRPSATRRRHRPRGRAAVVGRGGSGFCLERSHAARRQRHDVSRRRRTTASSRVDPTTGKEVWAFQLPSGNPSTRGVEYWPGDAQTPPQIVFGSSDGKLYSLDAKTGKPNEAFGDNGIVNLEHAGDPAGAARPQRPELAADRLQEPGHHRRHDAGEPAAGTGRRRARVGHAHRQAGVDVPLGSARRARSTTTRGPATAGRTARA